MSCLTQLRAQPPTAAELLPARPALAGTWPTSLKFNSCSQVKIIPKPHLTGTWPKQVFAYTRLKWNWRASQQPLSSPGYITVLPSCREQQQRLQVTEKSHATSVTLLQWSIICMYNMWILFSHCQKKGQLSYSLSNDSKVASDQPSKINKYQNTTVKQSITAHSGPPKYFRQASIGVSLVVKSWVISSR